MASQDPAIVIVDDEPEVLRAFARDVRRRFGGSYRILTAPSGAEALALLTELRDRGSRVALMVSDQRMPHMDGVTFLAAAMELHEDSKRVVLTAYADTDAAIAAINRTQVDYYLLKPWDPPEELLYPVLDDLLADWRAHYRPGYGGIRVVGNRWSPDTHRVRDFLTRNQVPYHFLDVEAQPTPLRPGEDLPVLLFPNGDRLGNPTTAAIGERVGLQTHAVRPFYDLAIVGAGPAGLAAAVYGASEGLKTVLIEAEAPGGQAGTSSRIENYLGFPSGLSGADLARRAVTQAKRFEVEMLIPQRAVALRAEGPYKVLTLSNGDEISCHVLMLSMGVQWQVLAAPGASSFTGRGVYYGASMAEAEHCSEQDVYIVGAGNSAGQAAMYFAERARKVVMLVRGSGLEEKMSQYLVDRIHSHGRIEVRCHVQVAACGGETSLQRLTLLDGATGKTEEVEACLLFVFIGAAPRTQWLDQRVARDDHGFVLTGQDLRPDDLVEWPLPRAPFPLETSVPGCFAAGDVRHNSVKRVASAVGEGAVAVQSMHLHLLDL